MWKMTNTVKSLFADVNHVALINSFGNVQLYSVEERRAGKNQLVCTFTVDEGDYFVVTMVHGDKCVNGIGFLEFKKALKSQGLLHPDETVED